MPFTEDLTAFFNPAEFAHRALIGGVEVAVIFEQPFADPFGAVLDSAQPQCWAPSASVKDVVQGDALGIDGVTYTVERVEPNGTGISQLMLYLKT